MKFISYIFKLGFLIFILNFSTQAFAQMGDWQETTPGGNEINDFTGPTLHLKNGNDYNGLRKWYFYKNHIIGEMYYAKRDSLKYFAVNENSLIFNEFKSESEWKSYLLNNQLKPKIWTKWYEDDWTWMNDTILIFLFLGFIVPIPLIIPLLIIIYKAYFKENFNPQGRYTKILSATIVFLFLYWIYEQFPGSI